MWITPIIFTLNVHTDIHDLLAPLRTVTFDLDGDGTTESWPWIQSTTAFLVWDPQDTKQITSGRQLFGTGTWWVLYKDGYQAMAALDNNFDGSLQDDELTGLSAWFDTNSDGVSQSAEVAPIHELGIIALATQATSETHGMLTHPQGLTLKDGTTHPTYDWVTLPADSRGALPLRLE